MDLQFLQLTNSAFKYWECQPLFTLAATDVFDLLAEGPKTAEEIVAARALDPAVGRGLLNAGVALKLLTKEGERYANSPSAARFLTRGSPDCLLHWVRVMGRWAAPWARLTEVARSGRNAESQGLRLGQDPAYMRDFILGMHEYASFSADQLAGHVDLAGAERLIDVGGGAGTYALALLRAYPELRAEVLDLEPVLAITREVAEAAGLSQRLGTAAVDYMSDPFGPDGAADAVLLSNVLHQEAPEVCHSMLARALAAVKPGGQVVIQGHFLNDDRISPTFTTLHNLSAFLLWEGGQSYTAAEMTEIAGDAGLAELTSEAVGKTGLSVVTGRRPRSATRARQPDSAAAAAST